MDNLKAHTHDALTKLIAATHAQHHHDREANLPNPEGTHETITCRDLLELYSHSLDPKDKFLLEVSLEEDIDKQMSTIDFKNHLSKLQSQMNIQDNEFKQLDFDDNSKNRQKPPLPQGRRKAGSQARKPESSGPNVENHPEYFRVDHEICHKLYQAYKGVSLGPATKPGMFSFEEKEQQRCSMNYQKIVLAFKEAGIDLEINQKLMITRSIKKFCFNQNFINEEEFVKLFKVIVHGLGYKEQIFQELLRKKALDSGTQPRKKSQEGSARPRKNYRFKTDSSIPFEQSVFLHDRRNTEVSHLSNQGTGRDDQSVRNSKVRKAHAVKSQESAGSYLVRAMESQKIAKITWESLFNMREDCMHHNIVIPDIVKHVRADEL